MIARLEKLKDPRIQGIIRECWAMSWPMTLIMVFIFFIGLTDVYVAGRFGKEVQAAYGLTFQIYFVFLIIAMALTVGAVSVVSRLFTSGRDDAFRTAVGSVVAAAAATGLVASLICGTVASAVIGSLTVPGSIKGYAVTLMSIYAFGLFFHYVLINTNGILRACKMIRKSLVTMSIVCLMNIVLNLYLSLRTPLGFRGIAVSTVASLAMGGALNSVHVGRILRGAFRFSTEMIRKVTTIGWPAGLLQILWQLGAMVLFLILANLPRHSVEVMAAFTNGLKIESAIFLPAFAFNMANAVVIGNLLGKKDRRTAFQGGIVTACIGVAIVSLLTLVVVLNARPIASFLSNNTIVINESVRYLYITMHPR